MDVNNRRQHVNRIVEGLGESGSHIPTADQAETPQALNSFTLAPEVDAIAQDLADDGLNIPMGAPNLFEVTSEDMVEERHEHPSPLNPGEVSHAGEDKSLEDKFVQAINNPELSSSIGEAPAPNSVEINSSEQQIHSGEVNQNPVSAGDMPTENLAPSEALPGHDHFAVADQDALMASNDVGDAGFAAKIVAKRQELKLQQQGVDKP